MGDGERDGATLPSLVRGILADKTGLEVHLQATFDRWAHLHRPGLEKKLRFGVLQAHDREAEALVAAVDRDRAPTRERLRALRDARTEIRKKDLMPVALGEAVPHGEAWVLGDPEAVRKALGLGADVAIDIDAASPKDELQRLHGLARAQGTATLFLEFLSRAADIVRPKVLGSRPNGFRAFARDVHDEIGPIVRQA